MSYFNKVFGEGGTGQGRAGKRAAKAMGGMTPEEIAKEQQRRTQTLTGMAAAGVGPTSNRYAKTLDKLLAGNVAGGYSTTPEGVRSAIATKNWGALPWYGDSTGGAVPSGPYETPGAGAPTGALIDLPSSGEISADMPTWLQEGYDKEKTPLQLEWFQNQQRQDAAQRAAALYSPIIEQGLGLAEEDLYSEDWLQNLLGQGADVASANEASGLQALGNMGVDMSGGQGSALAAGLMGNRMRGLFETERTARTAMPAANRAAKLNALSLASTGTAGAASSLLGYPGQPYQYANWPAEYDLAQKMIKQAGQGGGDWSQYLSGAGALMGGAAKMYGSGMFGGGGV